MAVKGCKPDLDRTAIKLSCSCQDSCALRNKLLSLSPSLSLPSHLNIIAQSVVQPK